MKKIFIILLISLVLTSISLPASAATATLSLTAGKTSYKVGDVFKVSININSGGNELQVVRAKVTYPADLLQAQGFTLGSLFPQKSPGETIGGGILYVGGYRIGEGTSSNGALGTITFKVLKDGKATLALIAGSRMITAEPKDIYSGGNSLSLTLNSAEQQKEEAIAEKPGEKTVLIVPAIFSSTHPENSWSNNNNINFNWNKPAGAQGYVLKLSRDELSDIGNEITTTQNSFTYNNIENGIWTLYLKAKYATGFSPLANYTIKLDTQTPNAPQPAIESQLNTQNKISYQIFFAATDSLSGIKGYEIKFDNGEFKPATTPYILTDNETDAKFITVKAIDNADNFQTGTLAIAEYIKKQQEAYFQMQQGKITLFDIQTNAAKRSWLEFYLVLSAIALIFAVIIIYLIIKKRK